MITKVRVAQYKKIMLLKIPKYMSMKNLLLVSSIEKLVFVLTLLKVEGRKKKKKKEKMEGAKRIHVGPLMVVGPKYCPEHIEPEKVVVRPKKRSALSVWTS